MDLQHFFFITIDQLAKGSVIVVLAFLIAILLRRHSAASRSVLFLSTFVIIGLLPFTTLLRPHWQWDPRPSLVQGIESPGADSKISAEETIVLRSLAPSRSPDKLQTRVNWPLILVQ